MDDTKRQIIKQLVNKIREEREDKILMAKHIEEWYIFWEYWDNEHYMISEIVDIINEVELEKNPLPVVEEPVIEEEIVTE